MSPKVPAPVPETLREIEEGSRRVNKVATELSQRIEAFEQWLNKLPGRVETTLWVRDGGEGGYETYFGLLLHRSGKKWIVSYGYSDNSGRPDDDWSWTPLNEASLEIKVKAVGNFPDLLKEIVKAQQSLTRRIEQAQSAFDDFAQAIGISSTEGQ